MYKLSLLAVATAGLVGCAPESPDSDADNTKTTGTPTHEVCAFAPDDDDSLEANFPIDQTVDWLFIESMVNAPNDIDLEQHPNDIVAPFALTTFLAPSFADVFTAFNILYVCSDETYALNQCNWEEVTNPDTGESMRVSTTVGSGGRYTATMAVDEGSGFVTQLVIDGTMGDVGNLTLSFYDEGVQDVVRESTRAANGTETVRYTSSDSNWFASETSGCNGSLDFDSTDDDGDIVRLDAQWSLNGARTTGSLVYFKTGMEADYSLSW